MRVEKTLSGQQFNRILEEHDISIYAIAKTAGFTYKTVYNFFAKNSDIKNSTYDSLVDAYEEVLRGRDA